MAALNVVLHPEAAEDVDAIAAFYASCTEDGRLAARFLRSLYAAIDQCPPFPAAASCCNRDPVERSWKPSLIGSIPYWLYYRVLDQQLEVIGVLHAKRDLSLWERFEG